MREREGLKLASMEEQNLSSSAAEKEESWACFMRQNELEMLMLRLVK